MWLPLTSPPPGTWPSTQACVLTGNQTGNRLVRRPTLNPLATPARAYGVLWRKNNGIVNEIQCLNQGYSDADAKERYLRRASILFQAQMGVLPFNSGTNHPQKCSHRKLKGMAPTQLPLSHISATLQRTIGQHTFDQPAINWGFP